MKISTKGRYALRVMIDLAEHNTGEYIPLMDIARRQDISEKYLEAIVATLSKNEFLISLRGKGGGYKLARNPEDYSRSLTDVRRRQNVRLYRCGKVLRSLLMITSAILQ